MSPTALSPDVSDDEEIGLSDVVPLAIFIQRMQERGLASENQVRWIIRNRATNGLSVAGAVLQPGGRQLYIVLPRWEKWLLQQVA